MKVNTKLSFFDKIVFWLNCLICFSLLISYLAPVVDPKSIWIIAFFGLAYPILMVCSLLFIIYWIIRKKWHFIISLITLAIGWNVLLNNFELHGPVTHEYNPHAMVFSMMTYNVHNFKRYGAKNDVSTKHEILQLISDNQPDIIGFQEFYTRRNGQYDMKDSIMKIMQAGYYYFEPAFTNFDEGIGAAIFSKFPIVGHGKIKLTDIQSENTCLYVDIKKGNKQFRVYSVHLQSIRFDPEDYKFLKSITKSNAEKTDKSSVRRLGGKLKNAFIKRSDQVMKIKEHAAQCPYPYIISGDFNDTPSSYAVNQMSKGLKNAFRVSGSGFGRTYNGDFPNYQIDYIMASHQFGIYNYRIIEKKLSDHYPVMSDMVLN